MFDCRRKVELDVAYVNTKAFGAVLYRVGEVRALQESFARNTADVDADSTYTARKAIVIAVGTRVKGIPQIGLEINKTTVISSDEALFLTEAPKTLAIVGAGAVGMEFADIFSAFGSKVTVVEMLPRALPLEDAESSEAITKVFKKRKIDILDYG